MTENIRQSDIHFMIPLIRLCNILAILPPYGYQPKCDLTKSRYYYRWYAGFVFSLVVFGSGLSIKDRFAKVYPFNIAQTLTVTDMGVALSLTATSLTTILIPSIWYVYRFKSFFEAFIKSDNCLFKYRPRSMSKCSRFYIELALGHFIIILIFVYDAYVWINVFGVESIRSNIFRDFQNYQIFIEMMTMYNFVISLKYRFETINDRLRKLAGLPEDEENNIPLSVKVEKVAIHEAIRKISEVYKMQVTQITWFNEIFGWQILFVTLLDMMGLLNSLDLLTVYIFVQEEGSKTSFEYDFILLSCIWSLWNLMLGLSMAFSFTIVAKEAQKTADICFSIQLKIPVGSEITSDKILRHEIALLRELAIHRCPSFSAAGFFTVNYSVLLSIFGCVTSYIIVLIQFNK